MPKLSVYRWWVILCFTGGPTSVALRSFLPAILQSITYNLGHQRNNHEPCIPGSSCFIDFYGYEIQNVSYVHYLRSVSTIVEIIATLSFASLSDSKYKPKMYSICLMLTIIPALAFFFVVETEWISLYLSSALYMVMMSVMALTETLQSSFIPVFMRNGIEGMVASSESFLMTNIASLVLLIMSVGLSYLKFSMSVIVFLSGVLSLIPYLFAHFHKVDFSYEEFEGDQQANFQYRKIFQAYSELMQLCLSWILFSCAMTNFVMNLNFLFRSTSNLSSSDLGYSYFVLASYISASSVLYFIKNHSSKISSSRTRKWIITFFTITIFSTLYSSLGWILPFGLKSPGEFWIMDVLYIACSSAFRAMMRPIYGSMIPRGLESHLYGIEIVGGLVGTTFTGTLSAILQNYTNDGHGCLLMSSILGATSLWLFMRTDIASGERKAQSLSYV